MNSTMTMPTQTRRRKPEKHLGPLHEPAAFVDGPNQYQYVGGDPVGAVDPEGLATTQPSTMPTTQPSGVLPGRYETDGWAFLGGGNFAGPGWAKNQQVLMRPKDTWDFIAKVHDLNYAINGITTEYGLIRQRDDRAQSRKAKADYIFRVLHRDARSMNPWGMGSRIIFDSSGYECLQRNEFLANDGFKNVLRKEDVPEFPGHFDYDGRTSYLMIPWSALTNDEKRFASNVVRVWVGTGSSGRGATAGSWRWVFKPDYLAPVSRDVLEDWRDWGEKYFGKNLWSIAAGVTSMTDSESKRQ